MTSSGTKCLRSLLEPLMKKRIAYGGYDKNFQKVRLVSATEGECEAHLEVSREHCNFNEVMHGGMAASLVDVVSTMALLTYDQTKPGVSIDLSISCLTAAKIGSELTIVAKTNKRGKNLAFLDVIIKDKISDKLLMTGKHTKFIK